jgi:predicted transcriptional regulator
MSNEAKTTETTAEKVVAGQEALEIADALNTTTLKMLQLLWKQPLDVSTIGKKLHLSEAYISQQVSLLESLQLIKVRYEPGKRGIRKVCESVVKKITIIIENGP